MLPGDEVRGVAPKDEGAAKSRGKPYTGGTRKRRSGLALVRAIVGAGLLVIACILYAIGWVGGARGR